MGPKPLVEAMIAKMPDDATFREMIRWVDLLGWIGVEGAARTGLPAVALDGDLAKDMEAFFRKRKYGQPRPEDADAKAKVLGMLSRVAEDVTVDEILNRIVLLKNIGVALDQAERGDVMDHDEFFRQLENDEEENEDSVAATRTIEIFAK